SDLIGGSRQVFPVVETTQPFDANHIISDLVAGDRVGIVSQGDPAVQQRIRIVFSGTVNGTPGVYATTLLFRLNKLSSISPPVPVVRLGDTVGGVTVTGLSLSDPLNRRGDVVAFASFAGGSGVVRATRMGCGGLSRPVDANDPNIGDVDIAMQSDV